MATLWGFQEPTLWIWLIVGTTHRTQENMFTLSYIMKDIIRGTDEYPKRYIG